MMDKYVRVNKAMLDTLAERMGRMVLLLRRFEWVDGEDEESGEMVYYCPCCGQKKPIHHQSCELALLIQPPDTSTKKPTIITLE